METTAESRAKARRRNKPNASESAAESIALDGADDPLERVEKWFAARSWRPFEFQREAWAARMRGESGLIHVPTGAGKTYAAFVGALAHAQLEPELKGLRVLYVTPLKAVARDIKLALEEAVQGIGANFRVEDRTGDTSAHRRSKQKLAMPEVLVTTPESLALLLCDTDHERHFKNLDSIVLDEWHECLATKRGSLLELTLTRLRTLRPSVATWALTATIDNVEEAAQAAVGTDTKATIVRARLPRPLVIETLFPSEIDAFPWSGQLGLRMLPKLLRELDPKKSTLIFTNTRSQAERWHKAIREAKPEWAEQLALHHGSLAPEERESVEQGVKTGTISLVVCTSSLDLGVDFGPVEKIVQIGSPKGVARLLQRAGRSAHRPGATSRVLFVPTNSLELVEIAAARRAALAGEVEVRPPLKRPLDVVVQHLITRAVGGGFTREEIERELRSAYAFRDLDNDELDWALNFIQYGGESLIAYNSYRKVLNEVGVYRVRDPHIALMHKMNIGTIASDATVELKFQRGKTIGQVEEGFIAKLKKGDRFLFSGRVLEYLGLRDLEARVRLSSGSATVTPSWTGGRLPYSAVLSRAVRELLEDWHRGHFLEPEAEALAPLLHVQGALSTLPESNELLMEITRTRQGHHLFFYPFEGRPLHEGLGALLALRLGRLASGTFSISVNDYGIELLAPDDYPFAENLRPALFTPDRAREDLAEALDLSQLARQRFREIARVAGLINPGRPRQRKTNRQLQVSAGLLFDVFRRYEPGHPLVTQSENQVLDEQLENGRLVETLSRLSRSRLLIKNVSRPTPFAFPLIAERIGARLSTESLTERIERMRNEWRPR
jgi:ATP-dependent Lhr-like helicase